MGIEPVYFRTKYFYHNSQVISWLQKYMELLLLKLNHPVWFDEIINSLQSDFCISYRKELFDEDIIGVNEERLAYCIQMIDLSIKEISNISKREFFDAIRESISGTWCDISDEFYDDIWMNDNEEFKVQYIGALQKYKELMNSAGR